MNGKRKMLKPELEIQPQSHTLSLADIAHFIFTLKKDTFHIMILKKNNFAFFSLLKNI